MYNSINKSAQDGEGDISPSEAFLNYATELLKINEEIYDDVIPLEFEGRGNSNHRLQVDGYIYHESELDGRLDLFIVPPLSNSAVSKNIPVLDTATANRYIAYAEHFIEDADYTVKNGEESSAAYGLAYDILHSYKNKILQYRIYVITDMLKTKNMSDIENSEINGKEVYYYIYDLQDLYKYEESREIKKDLVIDLRDYNTSIPCILANKTDNYTAYLCSIPGLVLAKLYSKYGGKLLEGNIRSFLQARGKVNKGIRNTILNEGYNFFAYNNGITATASDLEIQHINGISHIVKITGLQVVNGGQTTASLANCLINDKKDNSAEKIAHISVPMKLSLVTHEKAQELIPNIARYANSQNKVSESDLWSNHPFHMRMETFSRRIMPPRVGGNQFSMYWYYERANGQYKQETYKLSEARRKNFGKDHPKNQMFTKTDLAKYYNIWNLLPHIACLGGQKSFGYFANYIKDKWEKDDKNFNERFFRFIVALAIIFRTTDKNCKEYHSYKAAVVAYTMSKIFQIVQTKYPRYFIDFDTIWLRQRISDAFLQQIIGTAEEIYGLLTDDDRPVINVTEWAKRKECWDKIEKIDMDISSEFERELISKSRWIKLCKEAYKIQDLSNKLGGTIDVANFGNENWQKLIDWNKEHNILSPEEVYYISLPIKLASRGSFPDDGQCKRILSILEKAQLEGFPLKIKRQN